MKKTIAKIMAAAMVLSTVAAPNVLAASIPTDNANARISSFVINGVEIIKDGKVSGNVLDTSISSSDAALLMADNSSDWGRGSGSTAMKDDYTVGNKTNGAVETSMKELLVSDINGNVIDTNTAATSGTAYTSAVDVDAAKTATGAYNIISDRKNNFNGKYNDVVAAGDLDRWFRYKWTGATLVPEFNVTYSRFDDWMTKLMMGGIAQGTTDIVNNAGNVIVNDITAQVFVQDVGTATDDY
jgi:hypothetical protein